MGNYFPNIDPAFIYRRNGTPDDPFIPRVENKILYPSTDRSGNISYYVTLDEIPDYVTKVKVRDANGAALQETTNLNLNSNEYRVDYSAGLVYLNGSQSDKQFTFEYLGTGYVNFPAQRIVMEDDEMSLQEFSRIVKTLKTNWHPPVTNYAAIVTSIPSPSFGDTVQTMNDGKIYRYENGTWIHTQVYSDSAIADLQNKLATSLEDIDAGTFLDEDDDGSLDGGAF